MKENNILIIDKSNSGISHSLYKDINALDNCHVQISKKGALPRGSYDIVLPITTLSRPFSEKFFKQLSGIYLNGHVASKIWNAPNDRFLPTTQATTDLHPTA